MLNDYYTLANNVNIPKIGLGTWMIDDSDAKQVVVDAIESGYRHIDTAQAYENEAGVGRSIKASGVAREQLFITTKLAAEAKTYDEASQAIEESLSKLDVDYIDMMIIHSPQPWANFEAYSPVGHGELFKNDKIKALARKYGVSVPQLAIRYDLQLGLLPLPKSTNPDHMKNNADVDFVISDKDMATLKNLPKIQDYGDASNMPVFQ